MSKPTGHRQHSVTQKDIAQRCGISQMAVSLALRRDSRVSAATIERVLAVAAELGYDPAQHQAARRMVLKRHGQDVVNHIIAAFVPANYYRFTYYTSILQGMLDVLTEANFGLLIQYLPRHYTLPAYNLPPAFSSGNIDAAMMVGYPTIMAALCTRLRANPGFTDRPVISLMSSVAECAAVMPDETTGAYAVARHLVDLGHRRLTLVTAPWGNIDAVEDRVTATRNALCDGGLDPVTALDIIHIEGWKWLLPLPENDYTDDERLLFTKPDGQFTLADYLARHPDVTAFLAPNDASALHLWYGLRQLGRRVPEDISLVGFDDTDSMPDDYGRNCLTTVHLPLIEMGHQAARHLLDRINGDQEDDPTYTLPTELVVRRSTAPPQA
jgi:LacI family transcriptional regulator